MARGINKVILVGNLGDDPELRYTQSDLAIATASLATTSVRKDKNGDSVEETQWHRVTFFGKLAEIAGEYLKKGSQVYVEGSIRYETWDKDDGTKGYATKIIANEMQMLGGKRDGDGGSRPQREERGSSGGSRRTAPAQDEPRRQAPSTRQAPSRRQEPAPRQDDFDDSDIPF